MSSHSSLLLRHRLFGVRACFLVAAVLGWCVPLDALAQSEAARTRAAQLYDQGVSANHERDYMTAATKFEEANRAAPSAVALAQAVRAYRLAGDVRKAGTLALRLLQQDGVAAPLRALAEDTVANARRTYARVDVTCESTCAITIDGERGEGTRFFIQPNGTTPVIVTFADGASEQKTVRGEAGEVVVASFAHAAPAGEQGAATDTSAPLELPEVEVAAEENPYQISKYRFFSRPRATFFAVLVPTLIAGSMMAWSAFDARASGNDEDALSGSTDPTLLAVAHHEHVRDVRRTKWFAVQTGAFLFATALVAAFTDWTPHGKHKTTADVSVSRSGASFELTRRF